MCNLLIFHVNEISFAVPFWDMLRTCVQSVLPIAFSSFHLFSCVRLCATPWTAAHQDSLSITNSHSLLKLKTIESLMPSKHLILSYPLLLGLHSFLASGCFPVRQFFASGGQRSGVAASPSVFLVNNQDWYHASMDWWLHGLSRVYRSYSTFKVRSGVSEEIYLVQGKSQLLHFAGAAMKRYPTSKVR